MTQSVEDVPILSQRGVEKAIHQAVRERMPFSLVRLNDGESAFIGYPKRSSKEQRDRFLNLWWGVTDISEDDLVRLRSGLMAAARSADILGIPARDHPTREDMRAVFQVVAEERAFGPQTSFSSALVNLRMYEQGFFDELVKKEKKIGLISPHTDFPRIVEKHYDVEVHHIQISGEHKWFKGGQHFPYEYDATLEAINPEPGMVFLVAAGICGKVYVNTVKSRGGIGLDVGSIIDHWAGLQTRQYHKKLDKGIIKET